LHGHQLPDLVVDAFSPDPAVFWRRASIFCKAPLKKGVEEMLCLVQMRPVLDWVVCKLSAPGEAEGGSAGTQPRQGIIRRAHRADRAER
jgi:hypothetical protein